MVWKHSFCGGSNKGVVISASAKSPRIIVKMKDGDHVVHNLGETDNCEIISEEEWPMFCAILGASL
jgi:hypothetical protein